MNFSSLDLLTSWTKDYPPQIWNHHKGWDGRFRSCQTRRPQTKLHELRICEWTIYYFFMLCVCVCVCFTNMVLLTNLNMSVLLYYYYFINWLYVNYSYYDYVCFISCSLEISLHKSKFRFRVFPWILVLNYGILYFSTYDLVEFIVKFFMETMDLTWGFGKGNFESWINLIWF